MPHVEMTIADVLNDPLIGQLLRADGVSVEEFKILLLNAARSQSASQDAGGLQRKGRAVSPALSQPRG